MLNTHPLFEFADSSARPPLDLAQVEPVDVIHNRFVVITDSAGLYRLTPLQNPLPFVKNGLLAATNDGAGSRYSLVNQIGYVTLATPATLAAAKMLEIDFTAISPAANEETSANVISGSPTLAQLVYDLKQLNPTALISVRVAANDGVGTVAVMAANSGVNIVYLSAPENDAALPWYSALTQIQQALRQNGVRQQVQLCVEGPWQHGPDVIIAAILGADSFSFVNEALGERIAIEASEVLGQLGWAGLAEITGRLELLKTFPTALALPIASTVDYETSPRFIKPTPQPVTELNTRLLTKARASIKTDEPLHLSLPINRDNCAVGATLSGAIAVARNGHDLVDGTINITFHGSAGQGFGAFNAAGLHLTLVGNAADFVGLGMGGGHLILRTTMKSQLAANKNVIAGDGVLVGATGGWCFVAGQTGDYFAMHNQGATAVVEGIGSYGCAMMNGGVVINLGETGSNFGVGMRGGVAFVLDTNRLLLQRILPNTLPVAPVAHQADIDRLRLLITRHVRLTGSAHAQDILNNWEQYVPLFQKVSPQAVATNGRLSTW